MWHSDNMKNETAVASTGLKDQDFRHQRMNERVQEGKKIESAIVSNLARLFAASGNGTITPAETGDDKYNKVDAYWDKDGVRQNVQVKFRQTGDDILMELIRPFTGEADFNGRDMKGTADWYTVLSKDGKTIYWCNAHKLKMVMEKVAKEYVALRKTGKAGDSVSTNFLTLKVTNDPADGVMKMVGFIKPMFLAEKVLQVSIKI